MNTEPVVGMAQDDGGEVGAAEAAGESWDRSPEESTGQGSFCVSPWLGDQIHKATLSTLGDLKFNPGHWARASASPKTLPKGLADKLRATGGADRPLAQPELQQRRKGGRRE